MEKSEQEIETEIIKWLQQQPGIEAFKFPRGQRSHSRKNTINLSGHGVADIICLCNVGEFMIVIFMEVKKPLSGKLRPSQIRFRNKVVSLRGYYNVVRSVTDAAETLDCCVMDFLERLENQRI